MTSPDGEGVHEREEPRTKILLGALMSYGGNSLECHIRNLSQHGALVECSAPPPKHATVTLRRRQLHLAGEVAWSVGSLFGIKLSQGVDVTEWLQCIKPARRDENREDDKKTTQALDGRLVDSRLAEELAYVARTIENASEMLVNDPVFRNRHGAILQQLVIGTEMLVDLRRIIQADDKITLIVEDLRGPMRQRLLRDSSFESKT